MSKSSQTRDESQVESNSTNPDSDSEPDSKPESEPSMSDGRSTELEQQMVFGDGGDLEPEEDSVETSLEAFGAEVDHSEGSGKVAEPSATRFGVDDRAQVPKRQNNEESDQRSLFADAENDQQTLGGESAANRCLFGSQDDSSDDDGDDGPEETQ
jgi:hypothetical protein